MAARIEDPEPNDSAAHPHDVSVCVLSLDEALYETFRRSGARYCIFHCVQTWPDLVAKIEAGECGVAVIDTGALEDRVARCITELDRYAGRVVTLVAADRREAEELIGYLSGRKIHRLLIKPPAAGMTRLLLESAVFRYQQLLGRPGAPLDATGTHFAPLAPRPEISKRWTVGASLVLVAALVLALGWVLWPSAPSQRGATAISAPSTAATAEPAPADRFAELLASGERALAEGRFAEPSGDNALDYYLTILAADPDHSIAQQRAAVVVNALYTQAESALLASSLDAAEALLTHLRRADPESARLAFLAAQLERARRDAAPLVAEPPQPQPSAAAAQPPPVAAPTELESLIAIARARIARRQLIQPEADSAASYLERATQIDAADARVRAASGELAAALTATARTALRDGDLPTAARLIGSAQHFGGTRAATEVAADIAAARADLLAKARERVQSGALFAPEGDDALHYLTLLGADDSPDASATWSELANTATRQILSAVGARDWTAAETSIAALEKIGRDPSGVAALRRELTIGRNQERYLATAVPASELVLASYELPVYPPDALSRNIEGSVDVEFVVDATGAPRDLTVIASEPPRRFDQAALAAVRQYRYQPFTADGQVYERRVRLKVRFTLR